MSLLNRLKHNPTSHFALPHINKLLITSYLKKQKFKEAMKIFGWISRPDSPCEVDVMLYRIVVKGLCRNYMTVEALRVVKKMVEDKVEVGSDLRDWVYRSLLREARIMEANELNEALNCDLVNGGDEDLQKVLGLLEQMINNWTE
ncbi:hypothetical protein FRX31_011046 [Thalictrum thalictroides]|uniref:Pentatricopeptide repeat-containing protein n=1 Tax=Thalictrum thalictroides TaxID=46969 RepID=A0A7J6WTL4_THATH|nr:hypothetical protein FRX31_011046 [Thalictrum thalictroides]